MSWVYCKKINEKIRFTYSVYRYISRMCQRYTYVPFSNMAVTTAGIHYVWIKRIHSKNKHIVRAGDSKISGTINNLLQLVAPVSRSQTLFFLTATQCIHST